VIGDVPVPASDAADDDATALLVRRMRAGVFFCIVVCASFALFDLVLARDRIVFLSAVKLFACATAISAYALLRRLRSRRRMIAGAVVTLAVMFAVSGASALAVGESTTTVVVSIAVTLATATLLPWGAGPQLVVAGAALLSSIVAMVGTTGTFWALVQYSNVGLVIALGVSVYVAAELQRSRTLLAARHAEQHRAEAEVRHLNEQLEARVTARTDELERLTRALQAQIAERVEAESEVRRSEVALAALIEYANDAIWSIDRTYRVTAHNALARQRFASMFGESLQGGRPHDPQAVAFLERYWRPLYDRGLSGERFTIERALELPQGTRHYRTFFNPIVTDGSVTGLAIFSADITERLRAEEAAQQHRAELSHVLRLSTMGEMAAGLAHEINQPLAAIVNYAQGCSRRLRADPGAVSVVLPVIDDIGAEALRAGEIIRRLRALVRKEPPRQDWIDLTDITAEALRLVQPEALENAIAVHLDAEPGLPRVLGDPIQIEQVVLNLLRNAIDAMAGVRDRRELHVRIAALGDDAVELAVRDTGPGMPPPVAERIFDPFFSTKPSGLGMGLSISRSIVEAHQGRLTMAPNGDGGTTFRIVLPIAPAAAAVATG
jgi:C4-dicarboxylate-specific signal transduction histidine kinase